MKFSKRALVIFILLLSTQIYPQTSSPQNDLKPDSVLTTAQIRTEKIKADVLQQIQTFSPNEQAYFYVRLGNAYWMHDKKESLYWLTKGVELGIDPSTVYKNDAEKLTGLWNLLSSVLEKDAALADKLIAKIKEIKVDETNLEVLERANKTYVVIAEQILSRKKDENLALEFALLSLKGKRPGIDFRNTNLLLALKSKNENLETFYFNKLMESVKNNGRVGLAVLYLLDELPDTATEMWQRSMSDSQIRTFLELMLPSIQKDAEEIKLKRRNDCYFIKNWGVRYLEEYKKLLPEKAPIVEQAISVCVNSDIEFWKKPNLNKTPLKTPQDYLDFAQKITDKKAQAYYLRQGALAAMRSRNYRLSNSILDGIEKEYRDINWSWNRIQSTASLIGTLFDKDDFSEIEKVLNESPAGFFPFIVVQSVDSIWRLKPNQKYFALISLNRARAEFNKIDKFPPNPMDWGINPTKFTELTRVYVKLGFYEEAIAAHEDSIKSYNRVMPTLPPEYKNKVISFFSFSRFTNSFPPKDVEFIDKYFDRIYENIGKIEDSKVRLIERLSFLEKNLEKIPNPALIPSISECTPKTHRLPQVATEPYIQTQFALNSKSL